MALLPLRGGAQGRETCGGLGWWGRARRERLGWLGWVQLSHFLWEARRMLLPAVQEPHLRLLKLEQNVEAFSAYQEWRERLVGCVCCSGAIPADTAANLVLVLSKKTQEGVGPAAGGETRPSKVLGRNSSQDGPISQLLLSLLTAVTRMKVESLSLLSPRARSAGKPGLGENPHCFLALVWM